MSQHDCLDVLSKVYLVLDGEMSAEEEKAFLKDLNKCSCCLDQYHIERSFKEFLAEKVQRRAVNQKLVASIRSEIQASQPA